MIKNTVPKILTPFINLQSDYGFKRTFGSDEFRPALIRFLKAALGDGINIERVEPHNVEYHDKEVLPSDPEGKRIVYDVYFTLKTAQGDSNFKHRHVINSKDEVMHHFILEMQNAYEPPFEDRMTYYASKMLAEQGVAGWNYDLDPVILIAVTDFDFQHLSPQIEHEFELREKNTHESLTKKLRMLFYSLKRVPAEWADCKTELQRALYLIKNMDKMDKNSKPYIDGEFDEFFKAAESKNMAAEDVVLYSQSLSRLRSYQAGLDYRFEEGMEKGIYIGEERGRKATLEEIARMMKADGTDIVYISKLTGLSIEQIQSL